MWSPKQRDGGRGRKSYVRESLGWIWEAWHYAARYSDFPVKLAGTGCYPKLSFIHSFIHSANTEHTLYAIQCGKCEEQRHDPYISRAYNTYKEPRRTHRKLKSILRSRMYLMTRGLCSLERLRIWRYTLYPRHTIHALWSKKLYFLRSTALFTNEVFQTGFLITPHNYLN